MNGPAWLETAVPKETAVRWPQDREWGVLNMIDEHAIAIEWEENGIEFYPRTSGALYHIEPVTKISEPLFKR